MFWERCVLNYFLRKVHDKYNNRYEYKLKYGFESRKTFSLSTKSRRNLISKKVSSNNLKLTEHKSSRMSVQG